MLRQVSHRLMPQRSNRFRIDENLVVGARLAWTPFGTIRIQSAGQGEPLLITPGLWGGSRLIDPFARRMAKSYRVFWFDWPGEGGSLLPDRLSMRFRPLDVLKETVDAIGVGDLTIFAHSFGADVATRFVQDRSDRVRRLVLTGAVAASHCPTTSFLLRRMATFGRLSIDNPYVVPFVRTILGDDARDKGVLRRTIESLITTDPVSILSRLKLMTQDDIAMRYSETTAPMTVIAGERDVFAPVHRQRRLAEIASVSDFLTLPNVGHLSFVTHQDLMFRVVSRVMGSTCTIPSNL